MNRTIDYMIEIHESIEELQLIEHSQTQSRLRDKVRFIRFLKEGVTSSQIGCGAILGINARQSQRIWSQYRKSGLNSLITLNYHGTIGKLSYTQIHLLQNFLRDHNYGLTQEQILTWISDSFNVTYTQSGISKLFSRLKIKLKTGRNENIRKNATQEADFKKNLAN
jgi:transposase